MLIDGEKFACEACVRGHRVSNCQHSDRPLQHIKKKGRPVSQCHHCRAMRKSRSAHIKCDCGEKTSKCAHLQQPIDGHQETCCCNHGGRCTCCHKKEPSLDTVLEAESDRDAQASAASRPKPPARRRRANTIHSDGVMTFDQNGNHRPATKLNKSSQQCRPYQLNRVTSATSLRVDYETPSYQDGRAPESWRNSSQAVPALEGRRVKSENASPLLTAGSFSQPPARLPPLDLSGIDYPSFAKGGTLDMFGSGAPSEPDGPLFSAGLSATSVDWSHYDLGVAKPENFAPSSYSQAGAQSYSAALDLGIGLDRLPRLANTTSTSGEVSEAEDLAGNGDGDVGSSHFARQANMVGGSKGMVSIDYDSFYNKSADNSVVGALSMVEEDPAFWMPNYDERTATLDESSESLAASSMGGLIWEA